MNPKPMVRRCKSCGEAAVLPGVAWRLSHNGVDTHTETHEYRCQACGQKFQIRPTPLLIGFAIAGVVFIPFCIGIPILAVTFWMYKQAEWNPVVPDAPAPAQRYRVGPPQRRCTSCGGACVARKIVRSRSRGMPSGVVMQYGCNDCPARFTIESPLGQLINLFSGAVITGFGALFLFGATDPLWRFGGAAGALLVGLFMFGLFGARLLARLRHPVVPDGLLD